MRLVKLQTQACYSADKFALHMPHLFHVKRRSLEHGDDFTSYFYCPGYGDDEEPSEDEEPFIQPAEGVEE